MTHALTSYRLLGRSACPSGTAATIHLIWGLIK
jgi:hypothetical protein